MELIEELVLFLVLGGLLWVKLLLVSATSILIYSEQSEIVPEKWRLPMRIERMHTATTRHSFSFGPGTTDLSKLLLQQNPKMLS